MLSLFKRKQTSPATGAPAVGPSVQQKGLTQPQSGASLLASSRRQRLVEHIWQRTSLSRPQFTRLYLAPLERYAELVQQFPASESHHHAWPGGMLDHGLEIVAYALKLRQSYLLPVGAPSEDQAAQEDAWTAAIAYASLLHDIGKIAVDLHVELGDGSIWHPWHGPLHKPYRFRYRKDREYRLHGAATGLLYTRVLSSDILDWLSGFPLLWSALLYVLAGQYEHAGILGDIVTKADQASVSQALGGDPSKALTAPRHALQRKLIDGLRHLLHEELKLNQSGPSDGWLTQDGLWLVSKTVSDKLRAYLLSQGMEGIPTSNAAVFDVLQDHGLLQPSPDGKAIWRAMVTSQTGWSNPFTFLRLSPSLIWEGHERPTPFSGTVEPQQPADEPDHKAALPASPEDLPVPEIGHKAPPQPSNPPGNQTVDDGLDALLNLMDSTTDTSNAPAAQDLLLAVTSPSKVGTDEAAPTTSARASNPPANLDETQDEAFLDWLRERILARKLIINDAQALVHTVAGTTYLVSPGIFQRYAQEHPQISAMAKQEDIPEWRWVQKRFEKLRVHRKQPNGLNIWTCEVSGPRKTRRLHGYMLEQATLIFSDPPPDNPYLSLVSERPQP